VSDRLLAINTDNAVGQVVATVLPSGKTVKEYLEYLLIDHYISLTASAIAFHILFCVAVQVIVNLV
jgi:hypothetical protein